MAEQLPQAEYLRVVRPGLGTKVARRPAESESCAHKTQSLPFCSKDYEKARMPPGSAVILEDARRTGLYRLYTRRNCHHVNTHDPLKAIGLVANVDDQVVLTIQAAINYLTKYMGKLGTGHTATSRIGGLLDDILCRMQDHETMTVTSLLSKLFIHTAVPRSNMLLGGLAHPVRFSPCAVQPFFREPKCQGATRIKRFASHTKQGVKTPQ